MHIPRMVGPEIGSHKHDGRVRIAAGHTEEQIKEDAQQIASASQEWLDGKIGLCIAQTRV